MSEQDSPPLSADERASFFASKVSNRVLFDTLLNIIDASPEAREIYRQWLRERDK